MTNIAAVTSICKTASHYYDRLWSLRGISYHNPFMDKMKIQPVHGEAAIIEDDFLRTPTDLRVSCQTDEYLPSGPGNLGPQRLLSLVPLAGVVDVTDCDWECLDRIVADAQTTGHVNKIFNQMVSTKFRIDIGYFMDTSVRNLLTASVPTVTGTSITPAQDNIVTVTVDDLLSLEEALRHGIASNILYDSLEDVGDIIIYADKDLQAALGSGFVFGQNAFGGCCISEFASNITRAPGSNGARTIAYTVPTTQLSNGDSFFTEEGGYRSYFVAASGRARFGYNPGYVREKLDDPCAVQIPYTPQFMEKVLGGEYLDAYHEIFDRVMNDAWFFLKYVKNPVHKKNVLGEYVFGARAGLTRKRNFGFILKVKTDMFNKYIKNSQLTVADRPAVSTTTAPATPIAAEYVNDKEPDNAKVKPVNKK